MSSFRIILRPLLGLVLFATFFLQGCGETSDQTPSASNDVELNETEQVTQNHSLAEPASHNSGSPSYAESSSSTDLSIVQPNEERFSGVRGEDGLVREISEETEISEIALGINLPNAVKKEIPQRFSITRPHHDTSNEGYAEIEESGFLSVDESPRSTFSIDVDTASYSNVRRFLESGQVPPANAIRIEELINYFTYDDQPPQDGRPFSVNTEVAVCPWDRQGKLVRIGLKGQVVESAERQPANLVFLIDVSGSMRTENKLPLVKRALHRLLEELNQRDRISIVTYASGVQTVLEPTPAHHQHRIAQAIDSLVAGGSTNGSAGLQLAYEVARQEFVKFGTNRVILCSDGDFNVGITNQKKLVDLISQAAKTDVFLSVLGFGTGNYKDSIAEKLADHGNGNYAYIDSYSEARKVLVEQMTGTLETIAKDVKIQVEFNPANVAAYRLIGYENRKLTTRDFRDDKKDAGEIGAGHSVTALYEILPHEADRSENFDVPDLRYQKQSRKAVKGHANELLTVRVRYKLPTEDRGNEFAHPVMNEARDFDQVSDNFRFATSVAAFGMILRNSKFASHITWGDIRHWAQTALGDDEKGYRSEFMNLLTQAERLIDRPAARSEVSFGPGSHQNQIGNVSHVSTSSSHVSQRSLLNYYHSETIVALLVVIGMATSLAAIRK